MMTMMKLTMTTTQIEKKKGPRVVPARARTRRAWCFSFRLSFSARRPRKKKTNWGMYYSYYIYRRVYEMKTTRDDDEKNLLFFFVGVLFSSETLLLLKNDFELLRERIIIRKKQSTLFFGPKNFVVSQKKKKTKKKKKKTKETQQRRRGGRARKTGKKKRMRTTTTACTTRASVGTSTWRARTTKKTLRKTQRISLRPTFNDDGFARKVVVANGVEEDAMDAYNNASPVPPNVAPEEFERFYQLISCETTEEVIAKAEEFGKQGLLTEGVVAASHAMLEESKKRKDDERVIASLQGVLNFLVQLYQKYNAPPTLGVIDNIVREWQIMAEKGETTDEKMKEVVRRVAKEGNVELAELAGAVDGFKASMDEQDAQFEQQEAELRSRPEGIAPEVEEELTQMRTMRMAAKEQMVLVGKMVKEIAS